MNPTFSGIINALLHDPIALVLWIILIVIILWLIIWGMAVLKLTPIRDLAETENPPCPPDDPDQKIYYILVSEENSIGIGETIIISEEELISIRPIGIGEHHRATYHAGEDILSILLLSYTKISIINNQITVLQS